ncbi:hypothetical protein [Bordetella genomosp. 12]|uniref:hypothetical protein n=1 Tax=Bordetella genomosp. 12 TaxID=463035 RepID=UPI00142D7980|nr:hypothetical protein [Bordetella genomosp. 12]
MSDDPLKQGVLVIFVQNEVSFLKVRRGRVVPPFWLGALACAGLAAAALAR